MGDAYTAKDDSVLSSGFGSVVRGLDADGRALRIRGSANGPTIRWLGLGQGLGFGRGDIGGLEECGCGVCVGLSVGVEGGISKCGGNGRIVC